MPAFGHVLSLRRRELRFTLFAASTILQFLLILAFSSYPLSADEATTIKGQLPNPSTITAAEIFANNSMIGLREFIPALGIGWAVLVSISTAIAISAIGITASPPTPGWFLWIAESGLPFFWLELMAYSVALTSGTMLLLTLIYDRKKIVHELSRFLLGIALFFLFLWDAADAEYYTITITRMNPESLLPLSGWISNISVGLLAIWAYTNVYGPRLNRTEWAVVVGSLWLIFIFPLAYIALILPFLSYVLWKKSSVSDSRIYKPIN